MKTYKIYVRLVNPSVRLLIGTLNFLPSEELLDSIATEYAFTNACLIRSIEVSYRKSVCRFVDF